MREQGAWAEAIRKEKQREEFPSLIAFANWYVVVRMVTAWRYRDGD